MGSDLLRVQSNERVDLEDFEQVADKSQQGNHRQWGSELFADPAKQRAWIVDGFTIDNPTGNQVQVTLGRAILGQREDGQVFQGQMASTGEATRIVDVAGFAAATYGIFIRFEYVGGETQGRAFWNPQGSGSEFAQNIPTRRLANWSMRIEIATPGAEWFQVGQVIVAAGVISTAAGGLRDLRDFYFEGQRTTDIAPVAAPGDVGTQFESGWSTDGGGAALDRNPDRELNGVKDLQTFNAAMRQCIEDIKGRGLQRWWDREIGGMNIGFDADPANDRMAVGDASFYMENGGLPLITFEATTHLQFARSPTNLWSWFLAATNVMELGTTGLQVSEGLRVGFAGTPTADKIEVGDVDFAMQYSATIPEIVFEDIDNSGGLFSALRYTRTGDQFEFIRNNVTEAVISGSGLGVTNGLHVGSTAIAPFDKDIVVEGGMAVGFTGTNPVADSIMVGDANFYLNFNGTDPFIYFDGANDRIVYDRSADSLQIVVGSTVSADFRATQKAVLKLGTFFNGDLINPTGSPGVSFGHTVTIDAGVLQVGSVIRVRAMVDTLASTIPTSVTFRVTLDDGGGPVSISFFTNASPDLSSEHYIDTAIGVESLAASSVLSGGGSMNYSFTSGANNAVIDLFDLAGGSTIDTTAAITVDFTASIAGGAAGDTLRLTYLEFFLDL